MVEPQSVIDLHACYAGSNPAYTPIGIVSLTGKTR